MQMKNHCWLGISRTNKGFLEDGCCLLGQGMRFDHVERQTEKKTEELRSPGLEVWGLSV